MIMMMNEEEQRLEEAQLLSSLSFFIPLSLFKDFSRFFLFRENWNNLFCADKLFKMLASFPFPPPIF